MDNLSLNGSGGVTRRMTDKERILHLEGEIIKRHEDYKIQVNALVSQEDKINDLTKELEAQNKVIAELREGLRLILVNEEEGYNFSTYDTLARIFNNCRELLTTTDKGE